MEIEKLNNDECIVPNWSEGRPILDSFRLELKYKNRRIVLKNICEQYSEGWYNGFAFVDPDNEEYSQDFDTVEAALEAWANRTIVWNTP